MPVVTVQPSSERAACLEALLKNALRLRASAEIPAKLGLKESDWQAFLNAVAGGEPPPGLDWMLKHVYGVLYAVGAAEQYGALMEGLRFPLAAAGVRWQRRLGPRPAEADDFHHALSRLRLDAFGLHALPHVEVAGEAVALAVAGLLATGETLKVAIRVRPALSPLESLREDFADDALAAAGYEVLAFRDWQLRFAGSCALHVATCLSKRATTLRFPAKLLAPEDDHPVHRIQAAPTPLTPRPASPHWELRQSLRAAHPSLSREALVALYRAQVVERTLASAEEEEWILWG